MIQDVFLKGQGGYTATEIDFGAARPSHKKPVVSQPPICRGEPLPPTHDLDSTSDAATVASVIYFYMDFLLLIQKHPVPYKVFGGDGVSLT